MKQQPGQGLVKACYLCPGIFDAFLSGYAVLTRPAGVVVSFSGVMEVPS